MTEKTKQLFSDNTMHNYALDGEQYSNLRNTPGFYSPSKLKKLARGSIVHKQTTAKALGTHVHSSIEARLKGEKFLVRGPFVKEDGTARKRTSADSKELKNQLCLEKGLTEEQCVILTNSEFAAISKTIPLMRNYVDKTVLGFPNSTLFVEDTLGVGVKALKEYSPVTPVFQWLKHMLVDIIYLSEISGFKVLLGKPDLYCIEHDKSGIHIWDWKTTAKDDLPGIKSQIENLDYYFSLFVYCVLLEMIWQIPVKTINLVMAPKSQDATGLLVYMNDVSKLTELKVKALSQFFRDTAQTSKYIQFGRNVLNVMSKAGYAVIHN